MYESAEYFASLFRKVLKDGVADDGDAFIQSLIGKVIEVQKNDLETRVDSFGNLWSTQGRDCQK